MSGIIGPVTPGRIAFALGSIGIGAVVGGVVAHQRDSDVATGAVVGATAAAAGLALLYGGAAAWKHISAARTGAATGASQLSNLTARLQPATTTATTAVATTADTIRDTAARLIREASTSSVLRPPLATIPSIARTPAAIVPSVAGSGSTFLNTMRVFLT